MNKVKLLGILAFSLHINLSFAQNPILRDSDPDFLFVCDPSAEVFDGKVYLYCSHDQLGANSYESMKDYVILESSDLIDWTNHGVALDPQLDKGFEYSHSNMNAPDAAYKDGWYYWYFPSDITHVGVAKSQTPIGPWESAVNNEIATVFDPTVFVDDDGQAYIYGNDHWVDIGDQGSHILGAKLKDNMVELDGPWIRLSKETVNEAVHVFKREGIYYFSARVGQVTEYWMSDTPLPQYASFKGELAPNAPRSPNHTSAIEFNDEWYLFYHRGDVNNGNNYRRSVCFDKMTFREDGTIEPVVYTLDEAEVTEPLKLSRKRLPKALKESKVKQLENGNMRCDAEDFFDKSGVKVEADIVEVSSGGDWSGYENIEFGKSSEPFIFSVRVAAKESGASIVLRVNSPTGTVLGTMPVPETGGVDSFEIVSMTLNRIRGAQNIYLCYSIEGDEQMAIDWFEWTPAAVTPKKH